MFVIAAVLILMYSICDVVEVPTVCFILCWIAAAIKLVEWALRIVIQMLKQLEKKVL